jgi:predicted nucleotidyltransferase
MNDFSIEGRIVRIGERIVEAYELLMVFFFGSHAYGEAGEDSDIDLFIVKETDAGMVERFVEVKRLIYDPQQRVPVSPLVYTPEEVEERLAMGDDFVKDILRRGKVLYEKAS